MDRFKVVSLVLAGSFFVVSSYLCGPAAGSLEGSLAFQEKKKKDPNEGKKGRVVGVLTAKGKNFIEVKADGEAKGRKYVPRWVGGPPAKGGGLDKSILKTFESLQIGSVLVVDWLFDERFRAVKIEVLQLPAKK
jgi:hypothetical protein